VALVSVALAAGCTGATTGSSGVSEGTGSSAEAVSTDHRVWQGEDAGTDAYKFYLVTHDDFGFWAAELGAPMTLCADGFYDFACRLDDVDLSGLDLGKGDLWTIRSQIIADESTSTLVFVGAFQRTFEPTKGVITTLQTKEIWRAPVAGSIRASDHWYHVSHDPMQALRVNRWTKPTVTSLDLSQAPYMSDCDPNDAGVIVCTPTQAGVLEDVGTPAGLLMDGVLDRDGTLHVVQYMAKIVVGQMHADNGYWYCHPEQTQCGNGACSTDGSCIGLHFHGPGLKTTYIRTQAAEVQPWFVQTAQLTADESTALTSLPPR
jgi:hypothetical protein